MNKPIIVAEIGINHNGDLTMAKNMIALAKNFGADFVKFQTRTPELCVPEHLKATTKNTIFGPMNYLEYRRRLEFDEGQYAKIDTYCRLLGIPWYSSPWDEKSLELITKFDLPYIKVASACLNDIPLLDKIRRTGIMTIISTGMSDKVQIDRAIEVLGGRLTYILHTTSSYPTPVEEMNMNKILSLKRLYGDKYKIGFSSHCEHIIFIVQAYVMGAEMLEFHITMDRNLPGSDQAASIGPTGFDRIIKHLANIRGGWGDGELKLQGSEIPVQKKLRRVQD